MKEYATNLIEETVELATNLIEETVELLDGREVDWVGSADGKYAMSWCEFVNKFNGVEYDGGFGSQKIATDLVVVFTDGSWLERHEYDGSENWENKRCPSRIENAKNFDIVGGDDYFWDSLHDMNKDKDSE